MRLPPGIHTVLYALFDRNGALDRDAMRRQVEVCIGRGVAGIVTLGLATEVRHLTPDQRRSLVEWNATDVAGRVPLGVTIFEPTVEDQVAAAMHAAEHGAAWIILQPIPDARSESDLVASFSSALSRLEVPCAIQNAPQYIGVGLRNDSILRLCDRFSHLVAIKQEVSAVETATLIEQLGGRLQVFSGRGGIELPDCMTAGIHGHVPAPECVDHLVEIWALQSQGRREEAAEIYARLLPLATFVLQSLDTLTAYGKFLFCERHDLPFVPRPGGPSPTPFGLRALRQHVRFLGIDAAGARNDRGR